MTSRNPKEGVGKRLPAQRVARGKAPAEGEATERGTTAAEPCIVGIGASAGGFVAIRELLRSVPADAGLAFVVIQHLAPGGKSLASELLGKCTAMPVTQAEDGMRVESNHVYTNPPGKYLAISQGTLRLASVGRPRDRRLPIDHFFRTLGENRHEKAIGIILSGTGADGALGLKSIVEKGGLVIAQQPETAQFDGMPRSAINTGLVSAVLPVAQMAKVLVDYARHPYAAGAPPAVGLEGSEAAAFEQVMQALHARHGFSFAGYKRAMLRRRILRRMGLRGIRQPSEYASVVAAAPQEVDPRSCSG